MLMENLNWRYATKKMDPSKVVPDEKIEAILDAIRLAPTTSGLQPFEVLVIKDKDIRAKLQPAAFDQGQIVDSTALLVFAAWDDYTEARVDMVRDETGEARGGVTDQVKEYYANLKGMLTSRDTEANFQNAARQTYIALGLAQAAAAEQKVDSTPMEGFGPDQFDEILGLREKGLRTSVIMAVGYRDAEHDWLANAPKVRREKAKLFTRLG